MLNSAVKASEIKKYSKPEIKNLGKIGTKTQYGKSQPGADGTSNQYYNKGQDGGFTGSNSTP